MMLNWLRRALRIDSPSRACGDPAGDGFAEGVAQAEAADAARGRPMTISEFVEWVENDPAQQRMLATARRIRAATFPEDA